MYGPKNKYLTLWQPIQGWMKGCDLQSWFENRWGGEQRKQPDHWPLRGLTSLYKSSPRGEEADRDAAALGTVGRRRGWRCRWKSSRKGEVERRGVLSRGKVIRLGEGVRVVGTEQRQKWWRRGGEVLYWCRRGEASVGSEVRGGGKKRGWGVIVRERRRCNVGMVKRATYGRGESGGTTAESFTEIAFCSSLRSSRAWYQTTTW